MRVNGESLAPGSGDLTHLSLGMGQEIRRHPRPRFYRSELIGPRNVMPTLDTVEN